MSKYSSEPDIKSHSIYDDYEIRWSSKLGAGVSGPVRLCVHKETGQEYALKILVDREKSRKEISLHWRCSGSDYVVKVMDVYANALKLPNEMAPKNRLLVVMELMRGGELFEYITRKQHFTEREASKLTYQIARAIKHCHAFNIAHRDLKPENLLLLERTDDADTVRMKLGDFGFAKIDNGDLRTPQFTPYYVAPQVLEAQKRQNDKQMGRVPPGSPYHYDKSCDMWSLGVIVYIMLCGYPPFYSELPNQPLSQKMQYKIMSGAYEFPPNEWSCISGEAKNMIRELLHVDPAERMNVEDLLRHQWLCSSQVQELVLASPQVMLNHLGGLEDAKMAHSAIMSTMRRKDSTGFQLKPLAMASNKLLNKRKTSPPPGGDDGNDAMADEGASACISIDVPCNNVRNARRLEGDELQQQLRKLVDACMMPPPTPAGDVPHPHVTLVRRTLELCHDKPVYPALLQALEHESWNGDSFGARVNWQRLGERVQKCL